MRHIVSLLALSLALACTSPVVEGPGPIVGPGGARPGEAGLVEALGDAAVVVLGEIHDNPVHHARQARLVEALEPRGLAFEMVPEGSEEGIAVFRAQGGPPGEVGPAIGWERLGWPDWELYAPIFQAAPAAYVAGGAPPRAKVRLAARRGAAAAWGAGAGEIGLDRALDSETRHRLENDMIAAHCELIPRPAARAMIEAQRFKDARLAEAALRALERGGAPVALITGNGHARTDLGVPAYVRRLAPDLEVVSVGMIELPAGTDPVAAARALPYDYVWFSAPRERGDPCEELR